MNGEEKTVKKRPLMNMGIMAMVVTHALVHAAGGMRSTIMPEIKEDFLLNNFQIGVISAVPPLSQAIFSIPAGWISDRFGAKKVIAGSILMAATGALIAGFSITPWMYVVSAVLLTLTSTFYHPPAHSYSARSASPDDRSKAMGFLNAGGTFGIAIGPLSVSVLIGLGLAWRQTYQFWVIPIILGLVLLYLVKTDPSAERNAVPDEGAEIDPDEPTSLLTQEFLLYIASRGVRMFGSWMVSPFLSIYLTEARGWSVVQVGLMLGVSGVLGLVASPLGGFLASRLGEKRWVILSLGIATTFFLAAFFVPGVYPFMAMYLFYRLFGIMAMPGQASITARLSPPSQIGMGYALTFMPSSVTGVVAPMVGAWIADYYGYLPIFIVAAGIMYLAVILFGLAVKD
ncbi:MFS transporter [Candidatus Bathyarchaeota archaeon]|nr:MFS transporter [Candidatus Bathyarchaeota archaeon]